VSFRDDIPPLLRHMWGDKLAVGLAAISATALFVGGPLVLILDAQPRTRAAVIVLFGATGLAAALHWLHPAVFTDIPPTVGSPVPPVTPGPQLAPPAGFPTAALVCAWLFVAVGVGMVVAWVWLHTNGLGLAGGILVYTAIGYLLMRWRKSGAGFWWRGPVVLVLCLAAFILAWQLLVPDQTRPSSNGSTFLSVAAVLLLAGAVLTVPLGLALLSEDIQSWLRGSHTVALSSQQSVWVVWLIAVAGTVLTAGTAVIVADPVTDSVATPLLVGGALATVLLIGAITSRTQVDTVIVALGLSALLLVAPRVSEPPAAPHAGSGPILLALGDSYMSGEGAGSFYKGTDVARRNECRRAPTAYVEVYVAAHPDQYPGGVVSFACSGARAAHLVDTPQYPDEPAGNGHGGDSQVEQVRNLLASGVKPDLILLALGGNDSGFTTFGMTCVAPGHCDEKRDLWINNLSQVRAALHETYVQLSATLSEKHSTAPVVVVPYPDPINETTCADVQLSQSEVDFIHEFVRKLDYVIKAEATRAGFAYLGAMRDSLKDAKLRLCDGGDKVGLNYISLQTVSGTPEQMINPGRWVHSSFHPDEDGHAQMAATLADWLAAHPTLSPGAGADPAETDQIDDESLQVSPQCAITNVKVDQPKGETCEDQAKLWALGQTRSMLFGPFGLYAIGLVLGVWLLWLSGLEALRRLR